MESKDALESIKNEVEYLTRLDYVDPIVRGEVKELLYNAYHKTTPEFEIIEKDLEVLECFKKYFNFELLFENNQTFLVFKSKERYLPVDEKIPISNKYYEPLKEWLEDD